MKSSRRHFVCFAVLATLLCVGTVWAENVGKVSAEGKGGILLQESLEQLVFSTVRTKAGTEFSAAVLSDDITQLFKSGCFQDVETRVEKQNDGNLHVVFILTARKIVKEIKITGNEYYKEKRLRHLLQHKTGVILNENTMAADRQALLGKYVDAGFHGTEVVSNVEANSDGTTVNIIYVIKETPRRKLLGVGFVGATVFTEDELANALMTKRQWWRYIFRFGNYFNDQYLPLDKDRLRELYTTRGYLDFAVEKIELQEEDGGKWVRPVYHLYEGKPYTIGSIKLNGSLRFTAEQLLAKTSLKSGDVFNSTQANLDLNRMKAEYEVLGYLDLKFICDKDSHSDTHVVDLNYNVQEGMPSRIRDVLITGNETTQDRIIRRELDILPGDLGDAGKLRLSKARLQNMGYFESVDIYPVVTPKEDERDVRVEVKEKSTGAVSVGVGFSTEESVLGFLELQERNFDIARLFNWPPKGAGQNFRSYIGIGSKSQQVNISLIEPSLLDSIFELQTDLFMNTNFEDEYDERHTGGDVMLSLPIAFNLPFSNRREYWRAGAGVRVDHVKISGISSEERRYRKDQLGLDDGKTGDKVLDYRIQEDKGNYWANSFVTKLSRDTRDDFRFPTKGSRFGADAEFITSALGSYSNYARFHVGGAKYWPIVQDFVLKTSLDFSDTEHISGDDVRIFARYFGGGVGTVRGFKRRDISPVNSNENSIGGLSSMMGTFELMKPVKDFMYVSTFFDYGNVWWKSFDYDLGELNMSVGVGIQLKALPIRLDYGYPVRKEQDHLKNRHGRIHFNIMYSF